MAPSDFEAFFHLSHDLMCVVGTDGYFKEVNAAWETALGHSREELLTTPWVSFVHPDDAGGSVAAYQKRNTGGVVNFINRYRCKDGSSRWLSWSCSDFTEAGVAFCVARDITAQKRAEETLAASNSLLVATLESTADGLLVVDLAGKIIQFNQRFAQLWQLPEEILASRDDERAIAFVLSQLVEPERFVGKVAELYQHPEATSHDRLMFKDGRVFERYSQPQRIEGRAIGRVWSFRDVTDAYRSQQRLEVSKERLRVLLGCSTGIVFEHDAHGRILTGWTNDATLAPKPLDELIGRMPAEALGDVAGRPWEEAVRRVHASGQSESFEYSIDNSGEPRWFSADAARLPSATSDDSSVAVLVRETTERRRMEAQLLVADRMASVGTLAAGVAHEINNPLAYVSANLSYLSEQLSDLSKNPSPELLSDLEETVKEARHGAERVKVIVRDLKTFSRAESNEPEPVNVRKVLESSINMAWNEIRHRARLVKDFEEVPAVEANAGRLGQVFLNLLVNAAQAIPEGQLDRNVIRVTTGMDPSGRVLVEVKDSGVGISPDALPRLFSPFYTTKAAGVGTGLGLSICHNIVKSYGGELRVQSVLGKGSTFSLLLPPSQDAAEKTAAPTARLEAGTQAKILVLDDEALILSVVRRLLSDHHEVVGLTSPKQALKRIAEGERFDVIFCDVMMPELNAQEFHAELTLLAPDLVRRLVFLTGGAFTPRARSFLEQVPNSRIEKPFEPEVLFKTVRAILSESGRGTGKLRS